MLAMLLIKANQSCMNMYVAESVAIKLDCRTFPCRSSSTAYKNAHFCVQLTKECNRPANNDSALYIMLKINIHQCICICMTCICSRSIFTRAFVFV